MSCKQSTPLAIRQLALLISISAAGVAPLQGQPPPICDGIALLGTGAQIAATPRADVNLELLALTLGPGVTADQDHYDRVVLDVAAIRADYPEIAGIGYLGTDTGRSLILGPEDETLDAILAGTYTDWDCMNAWYELQETDLVGSRFVLVELEGIYDMSAIAGLYAQLPGMRFAEPDGIVGDGPTICASAGELTYHYFFRDASGDCPAGCIFQEIYYFTTRPDSAPIFHGRWVPSSGEPEPFWAESWRSCRGAAPPPAVAVPGLSPGAMILLALGLALYGLHRVHGCL